MDFQGHKKGGKVKDNLFRVLKSKVGPVAALCCQYSLPSSPSLSRKANPTSPSLQSKHHLSVTHFRITLLTGATRGWNESGWIQRTPSWGASSPAPSLIPYDTPPVAPTVSPSLHPSLQVTRATCPSSRSIATGRPRTNGHGVWKEKKHGVSAGLATVESRRNRGVLE